MNKKIFKGMSTAAIAAILSATMITPAFAKVDGYLVKDENGNYIQYSYDELVKESQDSLGGEKALLFEDYLKNNKNIVGYHDDVLNEYVNIENIRNAASDALGNNEPFDIHDFTKNAKPEEIVKGIDKAKVQQRTIGKDGTIVNKPLETPVEKVEVKEVSAITATTVQVELAEAAATAPTADKFAVLVDGKANVVKEVKAVAGDTTNKKFTLTLTDSLDKAQGNLTINGQAPANKVAKDSEFDFDFKAPTIEKVEAIDGNHIRVTFSEKMGTSAEALTGYKLIKNSEPETDLLATGGSAFGVLSADKKSVVFTTSAALVPANYTLSVKTKAAGATDVKDLASNDLYAGTEVYFAAAGDQLADVTAPTLVSASYNSETKKLTVNFDEKVKVSTVDKSKVKLGGVVLAAGDTLDTVGDAATLVFSISDDTKAKLPAGVLSLELADGAVTDIATKVNAIKAVSIPSIQLNTPPELVVVDSKYDENTHILTLKFNEPVKMTTPANITLGGNVLNGANTKVLTKDLDKTATDTVQIEVGPTDAVKAGIGDNAEKTIAVTIPVNTGIVDAYDTAITQAIAKDIAITQDAIKPVLVNATYKNLDKGLYLEFSEPVQIDNSIAQAKLTIDIGGTAEAITGEDIAAAAIHAVDAKGADTTDNYSKYVKLDLATTGADTTTWDTDDTASLAVQTGADQNKLRTKFQRAYDLGKAIKVSFAADTFYDYAAQQNTESNGNAAMTEAKEVVFVNSAIPTLSNATLSNKRQITVEFSARMNKADVENVNNYAIANLMYPSKAVKVASAMQDAADPTKVYLTVDSDLTDKAADLANAYKLTINNVKSIDGIAIGANTKEFNGDDKDIDTTAPAIKTGADDGVVLTSEAGKENDTIAVTFTETSGMDKASAEELVNYQLIDLGTDGTGNTVIPLTADSVSKIAMTGAAPNQVVTMKLKTINLQKDHDYKVVVTGVKDIYGNVISAKDNANAKTIAHNDNTLAANDVAFTQNDNQFDAPTALGSVANGKTTVVVTFAEPVDATTASVAANYKVGANTPSAVEFDAATNKAKFEIPVALTGNTFTFSVKGVRDLAGNTNANYVDYNNAGVIADLQAPALVATNPLKAEAKYQAADTIILAFNSNDVAQATAEIRDNYVISVNGNVIDSTKVAYTPTLNDNAGTDGNDTITITLPANTDLVKGDTVTVTAKNIEDVVGNKMADTTVSTTVVTVAPAAANGEGVDGLIVEGTIAIQDANHVRVVFADDVLPSSVDASDFLVDGNVVTKAVAHETDANVGGTNYKTTDYVELTLAAPIQVGANVTVKPSATFELKDRVGNVLDKGELFGATSAVTSTATLPAPPAASISNLSTQALTEAAANDGTLTNGVIDVTIQNGTFAADIAKANVVAANLPAGMDYTVVRTDDTHLKITVTGTANANANTNDVNNLTFTIEQAKVTGASADLATENISIDFND